MMMATVIWTQALQMVRHMMTGQVHHTVTMAEGEENGQKNRWTPMLVIVDMPM